ncbi:MAG: hypothetical protein IKO39_08400 [Treponema sp.]|nr:hypothetical protein [Treponema sp.]
MKRLLALVASAMLTTFAFAENTVHLGAFFPIHPATLKSDGVSKDLSSTGVGGTVDFTHVCDSGFTFKFDLGLARASTKDLWDESVSGVNFLGDAGFGWSFIHNVGFFYATGSAKLKNKAEALGTKLYDTSASLDISGLLIVPKVGVSFTF